MCLFVAYLSSMQSACAILYCYLYAVWLDHIFPHCLINGTIFVKKKILTIKVCFDFSTTSV